MTEKTQVLMRPAHLLAAHKLAELRSELDDFAAEPRGPLERTILALSRDEDGRLRGVISAELLAVPGLAEVLALDARPSTQLARASRIMPSRPGAIWAAGSRVRGSVSPQDRTDARTRAPARPPRGPAPFPSICEKLASSVWVVQKRSS